MSDERMTSETWYVLIRISAGGRRCPVGIYEDHELNAAITQVDHLNSRRQTQTYQLEAFDPRAGELIPHESERAKEPSQ